MEWLDGSGDITYNSVQKNTLFTQVLQSQRIIVTYEVILGIQRLINTSGRELSEPSWDVLCDILKAIADNISFYGKLKMT